MKIIQFDECVKYNKMHDNLLVCMLVDSIFTTWTTYKNWINNWILQTDMDLVS